MEKVDVGVFDYLIAMFNSLGTDGLGIFVLLIVFVVLGFVLFKILSFIVTTVLMIVALVAFGLFVVFGTDVNIKNWAELKNNATDILIVGQGQGCSIYMANENIFEELKIDGWKIYLGACDTAKENLNKKVDEEGFQKLIKTKENVATCPMAMATSRSQLYLEMIVPMKTNDCSTPLVFKEKVLKLNDEKKNGNKVFNDIKEKVLDLIVK